MEGRQARNLNPLLRPKSVAIIGASESGFYPSKVLRNLLQQKYKGKIFPVNPRHETILGLKSYRKITDIEEDVDLAVIVIPRGFTIDVLRQCEEKGVKAAIIISSGFAESDEYGKRLEKDLSSFAEKSGIILCGPNCAGLANMYDNVTLTARFEPPDSPGNAALVSQSGALMMTLYGCFLDRCVDLGYVISTGNQADLGISECIRYLLDDPRIKVIATFIEGIKNPEMFLSAVDYALEKGKPIIALKVGKTKAGAVAAVTHTGSIAGSDLVYDGLFKQKGVVRVEDIEELVSSVMVFSRYSDHLPDAAGVGIVSQSGGLGSLTADLCETAGLDLPELSGRTLEEMLAMDHLLTFGTLRNPADVRGAGTRAGTIGKTASPILRDDRFGALIILLARPAVGVEDVETASAIVGMARNTEKPIFVVWIGRKVPPSGSRLDDQPYRILEKGKVPLFSSPQACVKVVKNLVEYARFRRERSAQ